MNEKLQGWERFLDLEQIQATRAIQCKEHVDISHWDAHRKRMTSFRAPEKITTHIDNTVTVSSDDQGLDKKQMQEIVHGLLPWRTGPYNLLGVEIDAEWQSYMKWERLKDALPNMKNRRIADVGCNSGYFMFKLLEYDPQLVVGLDPSGRCYYQFDLIQRLIQSEKLHFEPFGIEHLGLFPEFFHHILCMGVLYHRRDPYTSCRMLFEAMKKDGTLLLESIVIPGEEQIALCPAGRYAKMPNVWFIPTTNCLIGWLRKAGFQDIEVLDTTEASIEEQRRTELAPYESLEDFLDPNDPSKTVEGFPAPIRVVIKAQKA